MLEAHGTGTALGDPIETGAFAAVLGTPARRGKLCVNSLKANAGHTEPGAGLAGASKLLMQLMSADVSPNAQLRLLNPHVGSTLLSQSDCVLPLHTGIASAGKAEALGGVSSFGYSGTIAHAVLHRAVGAASEFTRPARAFVWHTRRSFGWRDERASSAAAVTTTYATCWVPADGCSPASSALRLALVVAPHSGARIAAAPPARDWQHVAVLLSEAAATAPCTEGVHLALAMVQQLVGCTRPVHFSVLTRGALGLGGAHDASGAAHGGAWGFARVLRLEHAAMGAMSTDLPCGASATHAVACAVRVGFGEAEAEQAWRGSCRCVARVRLSGSVADGTGLCVAGGGAYVITGGLGGLGLRAGAMLVERGASHVALSSRSGRVGRDAHGLEAQLRHPAMCVASEAVACDSGDAAEMLALLRGSSGVLHAAGLADKGLLAELTADRVQRLCASKSLGVWYAFLCNG